MNVFPILSPWETGRERETRLRVGRESEWYHKKETKPTPTSPRTAEENLENYNQSKHTNPHS